MTISARYLLTDSRQISSPADSVFFAIRGPHHDGHTFIPELYRKGVREFVIEEAPFQTQAFPKAQFHVVPNAIHALQEIAAEHRRAFSIPVIGITGSNGKTIVKEWLAQLLSPDFVICRSPKSYNSQLGVPLSVWSLDAHHTLGIFEAGISQPGEMARLETVIQPTIGIFTNIGTAHDEAFQDRRQKIREKLELFRHVKTFVYCLDFTEITAELPDFLPADCQILGWSKTEAWHPFTTQSNISQAWWENLNHCIALLRHFRISEDEIQRRIYALRPVSMRLELKEGINDCYLIDDSYNNDLAGLKMALDFLSNQHERPHKVVILSDLLQSGVNESELYTQIAQLLKDKGVNQLIGIGEALQRNQMAFALPAKFFESTEAFLAKYRTSDFSDSVVLVKGARTFHFEDIIRKLSLRTHGTILEVNLDALSHNLNYFREKIGRQTKIMVMVKAFAYGSGIEEVANLLQFHRVDYLAVAYPDEGVRLRKAGIQLPILILNTSPENFQQVLDYQLEPEIYSPRHWQEFVDFLGDRQLSTSVHIKVDTGMHRLGFEEKHLDWLTDQISQHPEIRIASIFSHLAAADEAEHDAFTHQQIARYTFMADRITAVLPYQPIRHLANSPGLARFPEARFDMIRLGKGLYGTAVLPEDQENLKTVGTLKTVISQIKEVPKTETVGYGRRGVLSRDSRIATIAIGYADGFDRKFSRGTGKVLIHGQLCPIVGNICMDMSMVDVTDVDCSEGDEVIIFGDYPSIRDLASWSGTIPYEILTNVGERVSRVFYREGN
ncbi:alanine racemase [Siphonobacter curvatus]|uniref:Alanine racemase n=1 Tax=Siphonobacter curvatus TaxID=2094562 RepID=A0A2S7INT4_9BACT|nr:alanine racemase [Siphonobacter curvatus]PQA59393.1 alanine racemase [Siphonobacter curvatus]